MSLESRGMSMSVAVYETDAPLQNVMTQEPLSKEVPVDIYTPRAGIEAQREAFLNMMKQFSETPQFEAVMHSLDPRFTLEVKASVHLGMPSSY